MCISVSPVHDGSEMPSHLASLKEQRRLPGFVSVVFFGSGQRTRSSATCRRGLSQRLGLIEKPTPRLFWPKAISTIRELCGLSNLPYLQPPPCWPQIAGRIGGKAQPHRAAALRQFSPAGRISGASANGRINLDRVGWLSDSRRPGEPLPETDGQAGRGFSFGS